MAGERMEPGAPWVVLSDGEAVVRLRRLGPRRAEDGMTPVAIEVDAGPFTARLTDETLTGVGRFREALAGLHRRLSGTAALESYDGFRLVFRGDGSGRIAVDKTVRGAGTPFAELRFEMDIDQSHLPGLAASLGEAFPEE